MGSMDRMDDANLGELSSVEVPRLSYLFELLDGFELSVNHNNFKAWLLDYTSGPPDPVQHGKYTLAFGRAVERADELRAVKLQALDTAGHPPDKKEQYRREIEEELRPGQPIQLFFIRATSDPISARYLQENVISIKVQVLDETRINVFIYSDQDTPPVIPYAELLVSTMKYQWKWRPIPEVEQGKAKAKQLQEMMTAGMERDAQRIEFSKNTAKIFTINAGAGYFASWLVNEIGRVMTDVIGNGAQFRAEDGSYYMITPFTYPELLGFSRANNNPTNPIPVQVRGIRRKEDPDGICEKTLGSNVPLFEFDIQPMGDAKAAVTAKCSVQEVGSAFNAVLAEVGKWYGESGLRQDNFAEEQTSVSATTVFSTKDTTIGGGPGGKALYSVAAQDKMVEGWLAVKKQGGTTREDYIRPYPNLALPTFGGYITAYKKRVKGRE